MKMLADLDAAVDLDHLPDLPARFAEPLRLAAAGATAVWPRDMTAEERAVITGHGMFPLISRWAGLAGRDEVIGAAAIESLRLMDLRAILSGLSGDGVTPLILKGTALAYSVYADPELRPRVDVDLLVARGEFPAARAVMERLGLEERMTSGDELGFRQHSFHRIDGYGARHAYDVHLDITNSAVTAGALEYPELRARAVPLPAIGEEALGLESGDALLVACIHRVVHHHESRRLIWLYDVHLLLRSLSEEEIRTFWMRAAERRLVTICRRTVAAAADWFGGSGDDAAQTLGAAELARPEASAEFLDPGRSRGRVLLGELAALEGWRPRWRRLRQLAFPPAEFLLQRSAVQHRGMLPWLYIKRAAGGVARLFRRARP